MKIEYLRTPKHSYMVVKEADYTYETYEVQMILHNKIPNLLQMRIIVEDGQTEYWYDVTGMQALDKQFDLAPVGADFLCFLLRSICDMKTQLENYMLDDRNIPFSSSMVYFDRMNDSICFCYIPGYQQTEETGIRILFEEVLQKLDHSDSMAVRIGYDVYERCAKVDFVVEDVNRCLRDYRAEISEEEIGEPEEEEFDEIISDLWTEPEPQPITKKRRWEFPKLRKRREKKQKSGYRGVLEQELVLDYVAEKAEDWNHTVYFSKERMKTVWELVYQGGGPEENFCLDKFPFFLGKDKKKADGILHSDAVSRVHARITKEEDTLYLEDFNSTNGTYLNGRLLPMNTPSVIQKGDRIMLASEEYVLVDRRIPT